MQKENNFVKAKENGITGSRSAFKTMTPHGDCRAAVPSGEQASGSTLATITAGDTGPHHHLFWVINYALILQG